MYVIEDAAHNLISQHKNLSKVQRPDGGWSNNVKVDDPVHDENGGSYFMRVVEEPVVGSGPRNLGWGPIEYVNGKWQRENRFGPALPPPPDPTPADPDYAERFREYRKTEYDTTMPIGDQADALLKWATAIRMKQSAVDAAIDGIISITDQAEKDALKAALAPVFDLPADLDTILGKWTTVKTKFPKPG